MHVWHGAKPNYTRCIVLRTIPANMETILNMNKLRTMCHLAAVFVCVCTRGTRVFVGACVCALTRAQMSVFLYASVCKCSVCVHAIGKTIVLHSAILTWCINVSPCPPSTRPLAASWKPWSSIWPLWRGGKSRSSPQPPGNQQTDTHTHTHWC